MTTDQEKDNIDAYEKLLAQKDSMNEKAQSRYRYYSDLYGNEYRWTTHRQPDGKFHATYLKLSTSHGWSRLTAKKKRYFKKRSSAKAWCLKLVRKANAHQKIVLNAREKRKQERLDAKPKLTKEQKSIKYNNDKIKHYEELQTKCDRKIKSLVTRKKTYQKRIKYHKKQTQKIVERTNKELNAKP